MEHETEEVKTAEQQRLRFWLAVVKQQYLGTKGSSRVSRVDRMWESVSAYSQGSDGWSPLFPEFGLLGES